MEARSGSRRWLLAVVRSHGDEFHLSHWCVLSMDRQGVVSVCVCVLGRVSRGWTSISSKAPSSGKSRLCVAFSSWRVCLCMAPPSRVGIPVLQAPVLILIALVYLKNTHKNSLAAYLRVSQKHSWPSGLELRWGALNGGRQQLGRSPCDARG